MAEVSEIKPLGFNWEMYNPFLFCAHHNDGYPEGNGEYGPASKYLEGRNIGNDFKIKDGWRMYHGSTVPGFPVHPHRGFETVTIVLNGMIDHADSQGGAGRYGEGDVQWMTAGAGLQHSEMFPLLRDDEPNPLELFQVWLNLPKSSKFVDPYYKMLWSEDIPVAEVKDDAGRKTKVRLIVGAFNGMEPPAPNPDSWAGNPDNEVRIWLVEMEPGAKFTLPGASEEVNRAIYYYNGAELLAGETKIPNYHQALTGNTPLELHNGELPGKFLLLQGKPINEPVVQYGPFVMNSQREIQETFEDYRKTEFGGWPWPRKDMVHGKGDGRFARYNDGTEEMK